jgi:hypothetical protein
MANAKKCDRCAELYEKYDYYENDFSVHQFSSGHIWDRLDLCPKCHVDLILWMQGKAEFTLKEVTDDGTDRI